jgi:membrane protein required for colicin V production
VSVFDIALLVLTFLVSVRACLRGLVEEVTRTLGGVLGIIIAYLFFRPGAEYLSGEFPVLRDKPYPAMILSFIVIFILVFLVVKLITGILKDIISRLQINSVDHLLGFFFGLAESLALIIIILLIINIQPLFDKEILFSSSIFAKYLLPQTSIFTKALQSISYFVPPAGKGEIHV